MTQARSSIGSTPSHEPDQFDMLSVAGMIKLQQQDYAEGVKLLTAALRINPNSVETWANLGLALGLLDRNEEADRKSVV